MAPISTRIHAAGDYAGGTLMIAASRLPILRDRRAVWLLRAAGAGTLLASVSTDYELGLWRRIPMPMHLAGDAVCGAAMVAAAQLLRRRGADVTSWLIPALVGVGELVGGALTERHLSVAPPRAPESDTERAERAERVDALSRPGGAGQSFPATGDALVAQQESAAAAEAAAIGGVVEPTTGDPAMEAVYQAGGGEQEGWEAAEEALVENATHGDGHGDPARDALTPEAEADRSSAVYGEADRLPPTDD
ncbi:MAG: hypothetical protein ACYC91_17440 [Solirubrobacteraceae bacterium]